MASPGVATAGHILLPLPSPERTCPESPHCLIAQLYNSSQLCPTTLLVGPCHTAVAALSWKAPTAMPVATWQDDTPQHKMR